MLSSFTRCASRIDKTRVINIAGEDWFCISKDGKGTNLATGQREAPSCRPTDTMLMALAACSGDDVKYLLEQNNKRVKRIKVDVTGEMYPDPPRRYKDISVKYTVESDDNVTKEDIEQCAQISLTKLCPIANTLTGKPEISASIKIIPRD